MHSRTRSGQDSRTRSGQDSRTRSGRDSRAHWGTRPTRERHRAGTPSRRRWFAVAAIVVAVTSVVAEPSAADHATPTEYRWPVIAPVLDGFRAPASPFAAGNRGVELDTAPGTTLVAAADGTVTFAGSVAGTVYVTIRHDDRVRTTYGGLAQLAVSRGARVLQGTPIGTAAGPVHVSARIGVGYVDPAVLFGDPQGGRPHLVVTRPSAPWPRRHARDLVSALSTWRDLQLH